MTIRDTIMAQGTNALPLMVAHRGGGRWHAPEESMAAWREAKANGSLTLECDVRWSSDLQSVLMHDATLHRTTSSEGTVALMTRAELDAVSVGSRYSDAYASEMVPSLEEMLAEFADGTVVILIEAKVDGLARSVLSSINAIAEIIHAAGADDYCIIQCSSCPYALGATAFTDYGIPYSYQGTPAADGSAAGYTAAQHVAHGCLYPGFFYTLPNYASFCAAWAAAGAKIITSNPLTRTELAAALAASPTATGAFVDDFVWSDLARSQPLIAPGTVADWTGKVLPYGVFVRTGMALGEIDSDIAQTANWYGTRFGWPTLDPVITERTIGLPLLGWGASGVARATVDATYEAESGATLWFGLQIDQSDRGFSSGTVLPTAAGYRGILRVNGSLELYRDNSAGGSTLLSTSAGSALVVGNTYPLTLGVTATHVILTGNGLTIAVADTTYRDLTVPSIARKSAAFTFGNPKRIDWPALTASLTPSATLLNFLDPLTLTFTVHNTGLADATNVSPAINMGGFQFTPTSISDGGAFDGTTISWPSVSIAAGASKTLTAVGTVPSSGFVLGVTNYVATATASVANGLPVAVSVATATPTVLQVLPRRVVGSRGSTVVRSSAGTRTAAGTRPAV